MTLELVARKYAVAISPTVLGLVDPMDPSDPIARQFLPDLAELIETEAERLDPIGEAAHKERIERCAGDYAELTELGDSIGQAPV